MPLKHDTWLTRSMELKKYIMLRKGKSHKSNFLTESESKYKPRLHTVDSDLPYLRSRLRPA